MLRFSPTRTAPAARRGFTLLEVMLTLAVIVMIAGMTWPVFSQSFANERLRKGADIVRTAWAKARVQAMTSGQTHVFKFEYNTNQFVIGVWELGEAAEASTTIAAESTGTLPDDIVFNAAEKVAEVRALETEAGGDIAPQIFFYPDGTTSTAQVMLANQSDRFVKVTLRGLTGTPRVGELVTSEQLEFEQ